MAVDSSAEDAWEDEDPAVLPLGEEGMFFSAAGGEHTIWEDFFQHGKQYVYLVSPRSSLTQHSRPRKDTRTRRERTHFRNQDWQHQIERIVDGYLAWKAGFGACSAEDMPPWDVTLVDLWGT